MAVVFVTNAMLNTWSDQGKVRLVDTTLHLLSENRTVQLKPAVRFVKLIDGTDDPHKLVGKVKSVQQLDEMGAEHYLDSVIFGDVGYYVVEGFWGELSTAPAAPSAAGPTSGLPKAVPAPVEIRTPMSSPAPSAAVVDGAPAPANAPPRSTTLPLNTRLEQEALELSKMFLDTVREP